MVKKVEEQRTKMNNILKKLGLCMNTGKTQFIVAMNYQRRRPSKVVVTDRKYEEKMEVKIGDSLVKENDTLKTLGVNFDNETNLKKHWDEVGKSCWGRLFALTHLRSHLNVDQMRNLGQGLIVSKISAILYLIQ